MKTLGAESHLTNSVPPPRCRCVRRRLASAKPAPPLADAGSPPPSLPLAPSPPPPFRSPERRPLRPLRALARVRRRAPCVVALGQPGEALDAEEGVAALGGGGLDGGRRALMGAAVVTLCDVSDAAGTLAALAPATAVAVALLRDGVTQPGLGGRGGEERASGAGGWQEAGRCLGRYVIARHCCVGGRWCA